MSAANKDELVNTELSYSLENTRILRPYNITVKIYSINQRQTANDEKKEEKKKEIVIFLIGQMCHSGRTLQRSSVDVFSRKKIQVSGYRKL